MKILCLHPWGTSAVIFEKQISNICKLIGESHNYVFIDGPVVCGPAKGLPALEKGPFYSWYEGLLCAQVKRASDLVWDVINEEGPFDGVIGFSQGASLALPSYTTMRSTDPINHHRFALQSLSAWCFRYPLTQNSTRILSTSTVGTTGYLTSQGSKIRGKITTKRRKRKKRRRASPKRVPGIVSCCCYRARKGRWQTIWLVSFASCLITQPIMGLPGNYGRRGEGTKAFRGSTILW